MKRSAVIYCIVQAVLFVAVFAACIFLVGCKCPDCVTTTETEKIIEVRTHDTTIVTQADSASILALLRCDSAYNVVLYDLTTLQGERIEASVNAQKHGKDLALALDCKEDSLLREIELRDSIITTTTTQTTIIREKYVPNYYKNCTRGFWVLFVVLLVIVGWKAYKLYLKIQSGGLSQILWR